MLYNTSIIGGADGPTSVFLAGQLNQGWLNIFGLITVILLLIPNIIYAIKAKNNENKCTNKTMNILEQVGRYGCMFFMIFNFGLVEFGFPTVGVFLICLIGNINLMLLYWIVWILFFNKESYGKQLALAIIPTFIFLLNGIAMRHVLLIFFGIIFGAAHFYVTNANRVE